MATGNNHKKAPAKSPTGINGLDEEAEETLGAIRSGEVDALVVNTPMGEQVSTLKGADHLYRVIIEEMSESAVTASLDGTILYCNSRFADLIERPLEHVIGSSFASFLPSECRAACTALLETESRSRTEIVLKTSAGGQVSALVSCSRMVVDNHPAVCMIITDLTEQKRQEAILAEERRLAMDKIQEQDHLANMGLTAAALAHEIANPLQWMLSTVQLMQDDLASGNTNATGTWKEDLEEFHSEIGRLATMLQEFRMLARPENLKLAPTSVQALISKLRKIILPQLASTGIAVDYQIDADLPLIHGDADKLRQAIVNLCNNAIEATPAGGTLTVKASTQGKSLIVEITDSGTGIPKDFDIFKPFATTKKNGTGLGLMIVRQIVAAHRGSITYQSKQGQGTTFNITLPVDHPA